MFCKCCRIKREFQGVTRNLRDFGGFLISEGFFSFEKRISSISDEFAKIAYSFKYYFANFDEIQRKNGKLQ